MSAASRLDWRGYWPACPTPFFASGELDLASLQAVVDLYISQGVHGLLVNGTTGEWWAQSPEERLSVAQTAVAAASGRIPVVVGVSEMTPARTLELAKAAQSAGADGVLATVPPYVHPTDEECIRWYETIARSSPLPVMVYNWPRGVGVDLSTRVLAHVASIDNVAAIKDSTGDEMKTYETLQRIGGEVAFFARFISRRGLALLAEFGGSGNIDGGGIAAIHGAAFYEAFWAGDHDAAREEARRYQIVGAALVNADYSGRFGSPVAQVKAVMRILGQPGGHVRPPLLDVDDRIAYEQLMPAMTASGLLEQIDYVKPADWTQ